MTAPENAAELLGLAANLLRDAVAQGYPTPPNKVDQCEHGKFGWEDCIACYDEKLLGIADQIEALGGPDGQPALALRAEPASGLDAARFDQAQERGG